MENLVRGKNSSKYCFIGVMFCSFVCLKATTPMTTPPPTTPLPLNEFYTKFSASLHRRNKKLDVKPFAVIPGAPLDPVLSAITDYPTWPVRAWQLYLDVSAIQCLGLCLQRQNGGKTRTCRSYNFADRTCYLLNTFICDGERDLKDAPGFSYYDLSDDFSKEADFMRSKQCEYKGKCSNKCLKFKLFKSPVSWEEAHAACRAEEAFLAMPKITSDHETLIMLMKKGNILQAWIGVRKRKGIFYYDNGQLLGNYTVWGPDQPNDSGGTQQCVQMMNEMDYMWNDFDCARPVGYICQYVWESS